MRQEQIIQTALAMAIEGGAKSITMSAVAKAAGISRSAIYDYFSSSSDLISDLILDELNRYRHHLAEAVSHSNNPLEQVSIWIEESLSYVVDGRHMLAKSLNSISPPEFRRNEIRAAHIALMSTLKNPLDALGIPMGSPAISLLQSCIDAATRRIESGKNAELEVQSAKMFVLAGLQALSDDIKRAATHQI
ncbi:AcrR Transcriptional regulator [Candidatus Nanopelagicaceae bacterium]